MTLLYMQIAMQLQEATSVQTWTDSKIDTWLYFTRGLINASACLRLQPVVQLVP